jgi:hypothetical protein
MSRLVRAEVEPMRIRDAILLAAVAILPIAVAGCGDGGPKQPPLTPESWMSKPPGGWPQIVLTNDAAFNGHTPLQGASSFLVRASGDRILAATARHLIGSEGGVEPEVTLNQFDSALQSWKMFPRTVEEAFVQIEALAMNGPTQKDCDWLILRLKNPPAKLPAQPLRIRAEPVQVGEKVYLIGVPYSEPDRKQNVYVGKVTGRMWFGDRFRYDLDPPVDLHGFSGAPIIDEKGYLVGVMTVWFNAQMNGDKYLEGGGEDAATIYADVEGRR